MQNRYQQNSPMLIEKLVAAGSYITMGGIGFIWLLIGLATKSKLKPFLMYHIFQSIFISIGYWLICQLLGLLLTVLSVVPIVNQIVMQFTLYLNMPLIMSFSLIQLAVYAVVFYLALTSFQGQYSYIPWVSNIIRANVRG